MQQFKNFFVFLTILSFMYEAEVRAEGGDPRDPSAPRVGVRARAAMPKNDRLPAHQFPPVTGHKVTQLDISNRNGHPCVDVTWENIYGDTGHTAGTESRSLEYISRAKLDAALARLGISSPPPPVPFNIRSLADTSGLADGCIRIKKTGSQAHEVHTINGVVQPPARRGAPLTEGELLKRFPRLTATQTSTRGAAPRAAAPALGRTEAPARPVRAVTPPPAKVEAPARAAATPQAIAQAPISVTPARRAAAAPRTITQVPTRAAAAARGGVTPRAAAQAPARVAAAAPRTITQVPTRAAATAPARATRPTTPPPARAAAAAPRTITQVPTRAAATAPARATRPTTPPPARAAAAAPQAPARVTPVRTIRATTPPHARAAARATPQAASKGVPLKPAKPAQQAPQAPQNFYELDSSTFFPEVTKNPGMVQTMGGIKMTRNKIAFSQQIFENRLRALETKDPAAAARIRTFVAQHAHAVTRQSL